MGLDAIPARVAVDSLWLTGRDVEDQLLAEAYAYRGHESLPVYVWLRRADVARLLWPD
jgi:hypothetical protein